MPSAPAKNPAAVVLIHGDDEFVVKQRARQLFQQWSGEIGGMDHEIIDGAVSNSSEALKAIARLRESLQTLPFFGQGKVIWLRDCNFLGDERAATAQAVSETLTDLAQELKEFSWGDVRLIISAGKVDKRKTFYKTLDKIGAVQPCEGWSFDDRDWANQAEMWARRELRARDKEIGDEAVAELVARIGPNARLLNSEVEKLALYVGSRSDVSLDDVESICTANKFARAFALGDAVGDRDLPRVLRCLDQELWEIRLNVDKAKNEFSLLYGLITKIRAMLLLKEMIREGWIKPTSDYNRFKQQLALVPQDKLPSEKRYNPLAINSYVLFKALPQASRYTQEELVAAMGRLLGCNEQLILSNLDETLVLQQALVGIVERKEKPTLASAVSA